MLNETLHNGLDEDWAPPEPTRATLKYALRSKATYRGSIVDPATGREYVYHSRMERDFLHVALARNDVAEIVEQPPAVVYRDENGRARKHIFDARLRMRDGTILDVDVKPLSKIERSGIERTQRSISEQSDRDRADRYVVVTEKHLHPDTVRDARWVLHARRLPDAEADRVVADLVRNLNGWCRLADLVDHAALGSAGFNAAVRMIGDGSLEVRDAVGISLDCHVRRVLCKDGRSPTTVQGGPK